MGKVEIHGIVASPTTRAVMMVCEIIDFPYELKPLSPFEKTPEFKRLNPQQQIPVLIDDGFVLSESRAIMQYLMDKYAKDDSLYPKDLKTRAVINARLDFDCGTLGPKLLAVYRPTFFGDGKVTEEARQALKDAVSVVDEFLTRGKWVAGHEISIADISLYSCLAVLMEVKLIDLTPNLKVLHWLEECGSRFPIIKKLVEEGLAEFKHIIENLQKKI